ncbi:efflux RND transporter periplasmic adaptor subunit [Frigidibacter sp. MR17.14]|uniref:efflux RND transporter periplasmic adaptor subunit n=1 Tax=Frigidibacter sp. MR17.14 TaxID=3126509 RepID=UPI003012B3F7
MAIWKQLFLSLCLIALATVGAALWLPAARPWLESAGLAGPMERIGLIRAGAAPAAGDWRGPAGRAPQGVPVVALPPVPVSMDSLVEAIGTTRGIRSVTVAAEVTGRITALNVTSGERVEAGQVLIRIDDNAAFIAVERARVALDHAKNELARMQRLESSGSGTILQRQDAELALRNAELQLRQSEYTLSLHSIVAPIAGWVGIITLEPGDLLGANTEVTTIEDRSSLLVDFRVPERLVSQIAIGDTLSAAPLAAPDQQIAGKITALDNRVEAASRTLRVQAAVENGDDRLRAGMALQITTRLRGESRPAVDPLAIQWGNGGAYVWVVRGGKAQWLAVRILQRSSDAVLVAAEFQPGDLVITEGVQALRQGAEVSVTQGSST